MNETYGIVSLVPIVVIIVLALVTRKTFVSMLMGVLVGFAILAAGHPVKLLNLFLDGLYAVMTDADTAWVLLVCGLFGSLIALMEKSGGVLGFSSLAQKVIKGRRASMIFTWILGIIIFVDDYLNNLAVGAATRKITDSFKVPREMIAYIINSTGVTVCAIVPFSTWAAFMSAQMDKAGMVEGMTPISAYIQTIPYIVYGWLAVILVPLFVLKVIPLFGPMKEAEKRALETGEVLSRESKEALVELPEEETALAGKKNRALNFLIPMIIVAVLTVVTEDILIGIFAAILTCFILYLPQRLMNFTQFFDTVIKGLVDMFPVLLLIIMAYTLMEVNSGLGLTNYVIDVALNVVNPALLPVTTFVVIGLLSFASGSFWGLAAISFPIVAPLAAALGVNPFLTAGAVISAVAFGGHICIYSDTVILASASTQVTNADYFKSSVPLVALAFILAAIIFLILGFVI